MGLVLSNAKKLVEALGGTLQAESEPDFGTIMIIILPFKLV